MNDLDHRTASSQSAVADDAGDEYTIDFREILNQLREGWLVIVAAIAGVSLLAALYANLSSPYYAATMLVQQKPPDPADVASSPLAKLTSGLSGGLLGASQSPDYASFSNLLTSPLLTQRLAARHPEIMHSVFSWEWDADAKKWVFPLSPIAWAKIAVNAVFGGQYWGPPTADDLLEYLSKYVNISTDATTGIITISYEDEDPKFARYLIVAMVDEADQIVREANLRQTRNRIKYLDAELKTRLTDTERDAIIGLLANEYYQDMILNADRYYVASLAVPAALPIEPAWPDDIVMMALSIVLGGIAGFIAVWVLDMRGYDFSKFQARRFIKFRRKPGKQDVSPTAASAPRTP